MSIKVIKTAFVFRQIILTSQINIVTGSNLKNFENEELSTTKSIFVTGLKFEK